MKGRARSEVTDPLRRVFRLARPLRLRLLIAAVAGAAATGCGVALLAVCGFLLARASLHPGIVAIAAAIVAVRALSVGRGVFRYTGRRTSHDAVFRLMADVRAGTPPVMAAVAGAGVVTACLLMLAPVAGVLAAALLLTGTAIPAVVVAAPGQSQQRTATGTGLTAVLLGLALWGMLVLAVAATGAGALDRVPLAVVTLAALAAFDAVSPLAGTALRLRARARRGLPPTITAR